MNYLSECLLSYKYFYKYGLIIIVATPLIIIFSIVKNETCLNIITYTFVLLVFISFLGLTIMNFKYNYAVINEPSYKYEAKSVIKDITISGLWTITFVALLFLYLAIFSYVSDSNGIYDDIIKELLIPVNYAFNNGIPGAALLFVFIAEILLMISIVFMSCSISVIETFLRYRLIAAVFLSTAIYFIEKRIVIYLNNWIILLLGGPERVLESRAHLLTVLVLISEAMLIIIFILINIYFTCSTEKLRRNSRRGDYMK